MAVNQMHATTDAVKTGTSTIGITFDGGVVVGADHRATMGHFIANKSVQKLFQISNIEKFFCKKEITSKCSIN